MYHFIPNKFKWFIFLEFYEPVVLNLSYGAWKYHESQAVCSDFMSSRTLVGILEHWQAEITAKISKKYFVCLQKIMLKSFCYWFRVRLNLIYVILSLFFCVKLYLFTRMMFVDGKGYVTTFHISFM